MAQLIDGKAISQQIKDELKAEVEALKNDRNGHLSCRHSGRGDDPGFFRLCKK